VICANPVICVNKIKAAGDGIPPAQIVYGRRVLFVAHEAQKNMHVTVKLYATLRHYAPDEKAGSPFTIELSQDSTLNHLIDQLKIPPEETRITFVNGIIQELDCKLKDGDEVGMFSPIGGG
jgi:molybdopterin converting factor small subunit